MTSSTSSEMFKRMSYTENVLDNSWRMEQNRKISQLCPQARNSHNTIDSYLFSSSFTQVGCQADENEDDKSEDESHGKTKGPVGRERGKWCLQTNGDKQDLSVSNLDLIR